MVTGAPRFTFGINELTDGVGVIPLVMGLFGVTEVFTNIETAARREIFQTGIKNVWPSLKDYAQSKWAILRGSVLGFLLGNPARWRRHPRFVSLLRSREETLQDT